MTNPEDTNSLPAVVGGRYEIVRSVAKGGMGEVCEARDRQLDRTVAVKFLARTHTTDERAVARFRREATAAARLSHPNIVTIYDYGEDGNSLYLVMELVNGRSLGDVLADKRPLAPGDVYTIGAQVASALDHAHQAGIVHRDVKPGNILLGGPGEVKVTDFGIARALHGDENLTDTGMVIGTATYFAPEQAQGLPAEPTSDLYALGVVLYQMATGVVPFDGDTPVSVAYKQVNEPAPQAALRNPAIPPELDAVIATLMAKEPGHRYQSGESLAADLGRLSRGEPLVGAGVGAGVGGPVPASAPGTGPLPDATAVMAQPSGQSATVAPGARVSEIPPFTDSDDASGGRGGWFMAAGAVVLLAIIAGVIVLANVMGSGDTAGDGADEGDDGDPAEVSTDPDGDADVGPPATDADAPAPTQLTAPPADDGSSGNEEDDAEPEEQPTTTESTTTSTTTTSTTATTSASSSTSTSTSSTSSTTAQQTTSATVNETTQTS